jgi:monoterpene epsilon-lactone hydrolase
MASLRMKITKALIRVMMRGGKDATAVGAELAMRTYPYASSPPNSLTQICAVDEAKVEGATVHTLLPHRRNVQKTVIYTHGGSYVFQLQKLHWKAIERLIRSTGASVIVPIYPLAPEYTFERAYKVLETLYRELLTRQKSTDIILMGDSAGGGLAVGQALLYRDCGLPVPGRIILISPWLDLSLSNPLIAEIEPRDVMLSTSVMEMTARMWAGHADLHTPLLSPLHADLNGMPPVDIVQGTEDILFPDVHRFTRKVLEHGGEIRLKLYKGAFHVFTAVPWLPESRDALDFIDRAIRS